MAFGVIVSKPRLLNGVTMYKTVPEKKVPPRKVKDFGLAY